METIIKAFIGTFFLLLLTCLGIGLIEASVEAREADRFVAKAVSEIEAADCSETVIKALEAAAAKKAKAENRVFDLTVTVTRTEDYEAFGTAKLQYEYRLPLIGLKQQHTITADIR